MDDNNRQYIVYITVVTINYPSFADRGITKEQSTWDQDEAKIS